MLRGLRLAAALYLFNLSGYNIYYNDSFIKSHIASILF